MAAKFNNSKLTRIAHRKPPPKGIQEQQAAALSQQLAAAQAAGVVGAGAGQKLVGGGGGMPLMPMMTLPQTATDQKYALLFHITPFQLGNLGKFDVWTLSLPLMVTVHGSQDCDAQGVVSVERNKGFLNS